MTKIHKITECPTESLVFKDLGQTDYYDCYMVRKQTNDSIDKIKEKIFTLPAWIEFLLKIRYHFIVKPFGLGTGKGGAVVPLISRNENEIVVGEDDKHLYFRISILKKDVGQETEVYLTTVVKFNNMMGRLYFLPVKQFHKLVVRALLKKI